MRKRMAALLSVCLLTIFAAVLGTSVVASADGTSALTTIASQDAFTEINASDAWTIKNKESIPKTPVVVAVIGTGAEASHKALAGNVVTPEVGVSVNVDGDSNYYENTDDAGSTGTHASGIILASSGSGAELSSTTKVLPIKTYEVETDSSGNNTPKRLGAPALLGALKWVNDHTKPQENTPGAPWPQLYDIKVVYISDTFNVPIDCDLDDPPTGQESIFGIYEEIVNQINALHAKGILVVCASGDGLVNYPGGTSFPSNHTPNAAMGVIALDSSSGSPARWSDSNYNTTKENTKTISAPGANIRSAFPNNGLTGVDYDAESATAVESGTAQAAAFVTGVAAMMYSVNSTLDAAQAVSILNATAKDIGDTGWDADTGYGELDALHAMQVTTAYLSPSTIELPRGASTPITVMYGDGATGKASDWSWKAVEVDANGNPTNTVCNAVTIAAPEGDSPQVTVTGNASTDTTCAIVATLKNPDGTDSTFTISQQVSASSSDAPKVDLSNAEVSADNQIFTGSALTPEPTVVLNGTTLTKDTDYTVTGYSNNTNVGQATITIKGAGQYTGTASGSFRITPLEVTPPTKSSETFVFDGNEKTGVTNSDDTSWYTTSGEYTATNAGNHIAGATLNDTTNTIWSDTKNTNDKSFTWSIAKMEVTPPVAATGLIYNGSEQVGVPTGDNYTLQGTNKATDVDTYHVTARLVDTNNMVWAGENTNAEKTFTWIIAPKRVAKPSITTEVRYDGSLKSIAVTTSDYATEHNPPQYVHEATAIGSYETRVVLNNPTNTCWEDGSSTPIPVNWRIVGEDIAIPQAKKLVYNGAMQVGVEAGTGYTLEGTTEAMTAGTYTATAKLNDLTATQWSDGTQTDKTITWTIEKKPIAVPEGVKGLVYNGSSQAGIMSTEDYSVGGIITETNAGTYAATATLTNTANTKWADDYSMVSRPVLWSIAPKNISSASVSAPAKTYTGLAFSPSPTVTLSDFGTLREHKDFTTVKYSDNMNAGTGHVTVMGKGNFTGTATGNFTIAQRDIAEAIIASVPAQTYTGDALTPSPNVVYSGRVLANGSDFTTSYANNVNAGTGSVTISGKGNFKGTQTAQFTIDERATNTSSGSGTRAMYRLYNPNSGEHFYTASGAERDHLTDMGWSYEGVGWIAPASSNNPVYRLYNGNSGDHHYTMSTGERDMLTSVGWAYEGIGWYSDDAQTVPLYRQYNPNAVSGSHNYTTSKAENDSLVSVGWQAEGIGWYGIG